MYYPKFLYTNLQVRNSGDFRAALPQLASHVRGSEPERARSRGRARRHREHWMQKDATRRLSSTGPHGREFGDRAHPIFFRLVRLEDFRSGTVYNFHR